MDMFDRASELEQFERERSLAAQAHKAPLPAAHWDSASAKWCEGEKCGERIPDERRRAVPGVRFCVACQGMAEREERLRR